MDIQLPPDSLLTNTSDIVKACENQEISGNINGANYILVTQLASLLILRQYNHARHLWRRYKPQISSIPATDSNVDDLRQFQLLWNAVQPLLQSFHSDSSLLDDTSINIFTSLQPCVDANLHPLSMYAVEIKSELRNQMAQLLERLYDSIEDAKMRFLLQGKTKNNDDEDLDQYLLQRGWERESGASFWIPVTPSETVNNQDSQVRTSSVEKSKIEFLSGLVGFMEKEKLAP